MEELSCRMLSLYQTCVWFLVWTSLYHIFGTTSPNLTTLVLACLFACVLGHLVWKCHKTKLSIELLFGRQWHCYMALDVAFVIFHDLTAPNATLGQLFGQLLGSFVDMQVNGLMYGLGSGHMNWLPRGPTAYLCSWCHPADKKLQLAMRFAQSTCRRPFTPQTCYTLPTIELGT